MDRKYQFCLIDAEADYEMFPNTIAIGDEKHAPSVDQVVLGLEKPSSQVIVNLMGVRLPDRPQFLDRLVPRLLEMRARVGRPLWIIVDEAYHMLPPEWTLPAAELTGGLENIALITVIRTTSRPPRSRRWTRCWRWAGAWRCVRSLREYDRNHTM